MSVALDTLRQAGFTYVSFDMVRGVSITAWRGTERKTYSVYSKPTADEAFADLMAQIERSERDDFEDLL